METNSREKTILQLQLEIETALRLLPGFTNQLPDALKPLVRLTPPDGERAKVSLRHVKTNRQIRRNAPASTWSPESGSVSISYDVSPAREADPADIQAARVPSPDALPRYTGAEDPMRGLVLALATAEDDPKLPFISLKWFRDTYLPREGFSWATAPENRQRILADAISRNWILTSKVANPKNPQYPVTGIRVNRPLAEVRRILDQESRFGSAFAPITISGEPLSETVLRERR